MQPACAAITGISHYEAHAFACWAEARLPHEYPWEVAGRFGALEQTGQAREWNVEGQYYSLRGRSVRTRASLRRASFRNLFQPDKRHVFARCGWCSSAQCSRP
jgi:iron(II)-dependent oxidoreductase